MTTSLQDRLAALAESAPRAEPTSGLWERGRRWHRRRRAGTVLGVAVASLVLIALTAVGWQRSQPPEQLHPAGAPAGLPDRIFAPPRWLPGTDDEGAPGRLAALVPYVERGTWTGTTTGAVGISATTGEYRFLDLPDQTEEAVALSPDGRRVAYWVTGRTLESPRLSEGHGPVAGVGVWDTVTGKVTQELVPTAHGLGTESLSWVDDRRLVVEFGHYAGGEADSLDDQSLVKDSRPRFLDVVSGDGIKDVSGLAPRWASFVSVIGEGRFLVSGAARSYGIVDLADPGAPRRFRIRGNLMSDPLVNPAATRWAAVWGGSDRGISGSPNKIVGGVVGAEERNAVVPDSGGVFHIAGWLDASRVLAFQDPMAVDFHDDFSIDRARFAAVDVVTGASEELIQTDPDVGAVQFATDLLARPTVEAVEPPNPMDPRALAALAIGGVVIAVGAVVAWRRRVGP